MVQVRDLPRKFPIMLASLFSHELQNSCQDIAGKGDNV